MQLTLSNEAVTGRNTLVCDRYPAAASQIWFKQLLMRIHKG
jgi:hypothetical protein